MRVIIFENDDGWVSIVSPYYPPGTTAEQEGEIAAFIQRKDVPPLPDGSKRPSFIVELSSLDGMRLFFESWRLRDGKVVWHKPAADELQRERFRTLRKPLLEKLDVQFIRALESGDTVLVASIAAKKKELRDVTLMDLSQYLTPESLHAFVPEVLTQN
jgi:hypothetical protein